MIKSKLIHIEEATINDLNQNNLKLKAIRETKKLLTQIDFNNEVVPMKSSIKLKELLISLKGKNLTREESNLVEEITRSSFDEEDYKILRPNGV